MRSFYFLVRSHKPAVFAMSILKFKLKQTFSNLEKMLRILAQRKMRRLKSVKVGSIVIGDEILKVRFAWA